MVATDWRSALSGYSVDEDASGDAADAAADVCVGIVQWSRLAPSSFCCFAEKSDLKKDSKSTARTGSARMGLF